MIDLAFSVQRHILTRTDNTTITTNSKQIHRVIFSFSSEWEGTEKAAVFRQGSMSFNVILDENDSCVIPGEVLISDRAVDIHVSVYGIKDNTTITSTVVVVHAEMGSKTGGEVSNITPTLFEQIMSKLAEISAGQVDEDKIRESVEEYLADHPVSGTVTADDITFVVESYVAENRDSLKGEKGDKGDKGEKGSKGDKGNVGSNGKSAYEIACDNGFTGTEAEWIASLGGSGEGINLSGYAKKEDIDGLVSKAELANTPLNPRTINVGTYDHTFGSCEVTGKSDDTVDANATTTGWAGPFFAVEINPDVDNTIVFSYKNIVTQESSAGFSVYAKVGSYINLGGANWKAPITNDQEVVFTLKADVIKAKNITSPVVIGLTCNKVMSYNVAVKNTYGDDTNIADVLEDVEALKNHKTLFGKKVIFLGDSITALTGNRGWVDQFISLTGCTKVANTAVSSAVLPDYKNTVYDGAPATSTQDNNTLGNQVQKIINNNYETPDLIIIAIGTNSGITASDSSAKATYINSDNELVALEDLDKTRSEGAFRYCNETLHNLYPDAVICWCNPIQGSKGSREVHRIVEWANALKLLTAYGSVNNIETNRCGIFMANEIKGANGECLADGLHPNANGALKMAKYNAAAISRLFV